MMILLTVFLFCFITNVSYGSLDGLKTVVIIFRHGERTILHSYPNDPYKDESYWPDGYGALTNTGKLQHYKLGQWLRARYDGFLPKNYSHKVIKVRSTDSDRTLMSAAANLAGLYPPHGNDVWNDGINWQPIPIHTVEYAEENLLKLKKSCPKHKELKKELLNSTYFRQLDEQLKDIYEYLTEKTGKRIDSIETMGELYFTFKVEELFNYTLPNWTQKVYPDKMKPWVGIKYAINSYTPPMARLHTGLFLNEIVEHFEGVAKYGNGKHHKVKMYSGHDTTIGNVLTSLGVYNYISPPFASTILLELYETEDNGSDYYVNILYKNSTSELFELSLKNCSFNCNLEDFKGILKPIIMDEKAWNEECYSNL